MMSKHPSVSQQQLSFLPESIDKAAGKSQPLLTLPPLTSAATLAAAVGHFYLEIIKTETDGLIIRDTIEDLQLFLKYQKDAQKPVTTVTATELNAFLQWLYQKAGRTHTTRVVERHIAGLKRFFAYLITEGVLRKDPTANLVYRPTEMVQRDILTQEQIQQTLVAAEIVGQQCPRAEFLFRLLLVTGITQEEVLALRSDDLNLEDAEDPVLIIRGSTSPSRILMLPLAIISPYERYQAAQPDGAEMVFTVAPKTLAQDLKRIGDRTGDTALGRLTFSRLRWTGIVQDCKRGLSPTIMKAKYAFSDEGWGSIWPQIKQLADLG